MSKIKIVVPISGGKDSQACLKLALEQYEPSELLGLFCDTKFEHPLTYKHIDKIESIYGVKIERVSVGSVPELILKNKRFPDSVYKFCTRDLKIKPSNDFYIDLAKKQGFGFEVWIGVRTGESKKRESTYKNHISTELYEPHYFLSNFSAKLTKKGVMFRLPIVDWTNEEVFNYVGLDNVNPLYKMGCDRVGCFPCLASGKSKQRYELNLDDFGQSQKKIIANLAEKIGNPSRNQDDLFSGCAFCAI